MCRRLGLAPSAQDVIPQFPALILLPAVWPLVDGDDELVGRTQEIEQA